MFSGPPKSGLSWQSGPGSFTVSGRVVSVHDGVPFEHALVRLTPGRHSVQTDRGGSFRLAGLQGGRYYLEVLAVGKVKAADSVTVGDDGLYVLAAIASYTGDISCVRPASTR
jgi:hypothetical protein